jgi:hypothetical protein
MFLFRDFSVLIFFFQKSNMATGLFDVLVGKYEERKPLEDMILFMSIILKFIFNNTTRSFRLETNG